MRARPRSPQVCDDRSDLIDRRAVIFHAVSAHVRLYHLRAGGFSFIGINGIRDPATPPRCDAKISSNDQTRIRPAYLRESAFCFFILLFYYYHREINDDMIIGRRRLRLEDLHATIHSPMAGA